MARAAMKGATARVNFILKKFEEKGLVKAKEFVSECRRRKSVDDEKKRRSKLGTGLPLILERCCMQVIHDGP